MYDVKCYELHSHMFDHQRIHSKFENSIYPYVSNGGWGLKEYFCLIAHISHKFISQQTGLSYKQATAATARKYYIINTKKY